jgi:hypothetical protein
MNYIPLDNIGLPRKNEDGTLSTIREQGNNYPSNDTGIQKSKYVTTRSNNIILFGKYSKNEKTYPLLDPSKFNIVPVQNASFRFIINFGSSKSYTSIGLYRDLIKAYEERNPWFSVNTVPRVNLDLFFLKEYHKKNKFKVTEAYCETEVITTLDEDVDILQYINYLVSKSKNDIEIKPVDELGNWRYVPDEDLGIGLKKLYDSMIKNKQPNPEDVGAQIIREDYVLELPAVNEVATGLQPLPDLDIIPRLVDAILNERVPEGKKEYNKFGPAGLQVLAGVVAVAATLATFGALAPIFAAVGGLSATAVAAGVGAVGALAPLTANGIQVLNNAIKKVNGSWLEYILKRSTTRELFQSTSKVFEEERKADLAEWRSLLIAVRGEMGVTQYTKSQLQDALKIIFSALGPNVKPADLSYPIEVGNDVKRFQVIVKSDRDVDLILK